LALSRISISSSSVNAIGLPFILLDFVAADLDDNIGVTFSDFCLFAARWLDNDCGACGGADLTGDGRVRTDDLQQFAENWLGGVAPQAGLHFAVVGPAGGYALLTGPGGQL